MEISAEDIMNYHCPRWSELPEIELYIDQVVCILENNLSLFNNNPKVPIITSTMIIWKWPPTSMPKSQGLLFPSNRR